MHFYWQKLNFPLLGNGREQVILLSFFIHVLHQRYSGGGGRDQEVNVRGSAVPRAAAGGGDLLEDRGGGQPRPRVVEAGRRGGRRPAGKTA